MAKYLIEITKVNENKGCNTVTAVLVVIILIIWIAHL